MQNKANWKIDQMTLTKVLTTDYNRRTLGIRGKNKAKTKPNKKIKKTVTNSPQDGLYIQQVKKKWYG